MENSANQTQKKTMSTQAVDRDSVYKAVEQGKFGIANGKTKVEVVRIMYPFIINEPPEVIWTAFVEGAGLTEKGAVTYWYNVRREQRKSKPNVTDDHGKQN